MLEKPVCKILHMLQKIAEGRRAVKALFMLHRDQTGRRQRLQCGMRAKTVVLEV